MNFFNTIQNLIFNEILNGLFKWNFDSIFFHEIDHQIFQLYSILNIAIKFQIKLFNEI